MVDFRDFDFTFFDRLRATAIHLYGEPIGEGRHRVVFKDGDWVLKVPTSPSGLNANCGEAADYAVTGSPFARCFIDAELSSTKFDSCPILRMEYVVHVGASKVPDWTWSIDCGQVGLNSEGVLVAYDWDRY